MPVVVLRHVPGLMVQKTVEPPQLQSIFGRRHSLSFRRGRASWSRLFSGSLRFRSCRSLFGGRCPCCSGRADSQVPPWRRPCFFFFGRPRCSASWLVWLTRTAMPGHSGAWLVLLFGQTSTEASGRIHHILREREREPRSRGRFSPWITSSI